MLRRLPLVLVVTLALLAAARPAGAGGNKPEDVFGGRILTSKVRYPLTARSPADYIRKLRKQSTENLFEDKAKKSWKIYFAAFFKAPLNDLEVTIKVYDITDGGRQLKESFEQYLEESGQRVIISDLTLTREREGVNRRMLITIENRNRVIAQGRFKILGEAEHYSGQVNFTEEDTKKEE